MLGKGSEVNKEFRCVSKTVTLHRFRESVRLRSVQTAKGQDAWAEMTDSCRYGKHGSAMSRFDQEIESIKCIDKLRDSLLPRCNVAGGTTVGLWATAPDASSDSWDVADGR